MASTNEPFTKQMRQVTREIHGISDALINAKLGIAMSEDRVWAEGLLVFYEIFKYLEEALDRLGDSLIGLLDVPGIRRTALFEEDLVHYLGEGWKSGYKPRESVSTYLKHLKTLEKNDPYLLTAYIYHLYMGLLSGGQILKKKKAFFQKFSFSNDGSTSGLAVTEIKGETVYSVKKKMTDAMNQIASDLDEETREKLLEESKMVFILNNNMVNSIEGAGAVAIIKLIKFTMMGILVAGAAVLIKRMIYPNS